MVQEPALLEHDQEPPEHGTAPVLELASPGGSKERFPIAKTAHGQFADKLGIPKKHYDRLLSDHPDLLTLELNALLNREPERRMLRTLDGKARAFLSDKYRPLDNYDLAEAVLPILQTVPDINIVSTQFTDTRFFIKAVFPKVTGEVRVGDIVQGGIQISNSETGHGSLSVMPLMYRLWCLNGCTTNIGSKRRAHVGSRQDSDTFEVFSDATKAQSDRAFWMQVQDTVRGLTTPEVFNRVLAEVQAAAGDQITKPVQETVELATKALGIKQADQEGILRHLIEGTGNAANGGQLADLTRYGLMNAITQHSQDVEDYGHATELERAGGKILELAPADWQRIAVAQPVAA